MWSISKLFFCMRAVLKLTTPTRFIADQTGAVLSFELLLVATVVVVGMVVALTASRDAVVSELSDVAGSVQDVHQGLTYNGTVSASGATAGSGFLDALDPNDDSEDASGLADNCILFDVAPVDESSTSVVLSDSATLSFDSVTTGVGGSATGTIGDGATDTTFSISATGNGNIAGITGGTELRFRETDAFDGRFTIAFDDPITDFELFIRGLNNVVDAAENLLGNFILTLSDGTIIGNAPFSILPDAITENESFGLFSTRDDDNSTLSAVNRGGLDFVTDPAADGTENQAAGRIVFPDIPAAFSSSASGLGLSSISFDREGGPNNNSFQANVSVSGQVIGEASP